VKSLWANKGYTQREGIDYNEASYMCKALVDLDIVDASGTIRVGA